MALAVSTLAIEKSTNRSAADCRFCADHRNCRSDYQEIASSAAPLDRSMHMSRLLAPIAVVGVLSADTLVNRPVPMHSDPKFPLQLRRLTVQVENVLKGGPLPSLITVYYFTWAGGFDGPRRFGVLAGGRSASVVVAPKGCRCAPHCL